MLPVIEKNFVLPLIQLLTRENFLSYLKSSKDLQYWDKEKILNYQWQNTRKIVRHAINTVPFYKKKYEEYGININQIQDPDDFKKLPFLGKEEIRSNSSQLISILHSKNLSLTHSSGTMGLPINIYRDPYSYTIDRAVKYRSLEWYGVNVGQKEARIWGYSTDKRIKRKQILQDIVLNRIRMAPFDLNIKEVEKFYREIKSFKPKVLYGWLSGLFKFSQIAHENNLNISDSSLKVIVSTAEPLNNFQRMIIEDTFNRKLANEYGCSEVGVIAFECQFGKMHLMIDNVYTEFIKNPSTGVSEIVLTDLKNYSMPIIRYKIGDVGSLADPTFGCKCGVNLPMMNIVEGRRLDIIRTPDGKYIHGGIFAYIGFDLIKKYGSIKDFRIRQSLNYDIHIKYSEQDSFNNAIIDEFKSLIKNYIGNNIKIKFESVDAIPLEESGKQRFVISEFTQY